MDKKKSSPDKPSRFFGRRKGRTLNKQRQNALSQLSDFEIPKSLIENEDILPIYDLFPNHIKEIHLEIGFGNGDFLANSVSKHPDIGFIGAEPYLNGVSACIKKLSETNLDNHQSDNLKIWADDVRLLLPLLPDQSIDKIYILNPDPWPKTRHHKRRIVNRHNLDALWRICKPQGTILMTTDIDDLASWMATHIVNHPNFTWDIDHPSQTQIPPSNWDPTRYEEKGQIAGRNQHYIFAKRK